MNSDEAIAAIRAVDPAATYTETLRVDETSRVLEILLIVPVLQQIFGAVNDSGDPNEDGEARDQALADAAAAVPP
jgi:hypothetical protein